MERTGSGFQVRWLLLPACWALLASGLDLQRQGWTGLSLRPDGRVAVVAPGSPGARAGLRPGDRLTASEPAGRTALLEESPIASARAGQPILLVRERAGQQTAVWLVPAERPEPERRFNAVQFAVAVAFLLLGGWVWSERRDRLTRTFLLLTLAFAVVLAPPPQLDASVASLAYTFLSVLASLFIGPLFSHFFALFPGGTRTRARAWVLTCYAVATVLLACFLGVLIESLAGGTRGSALLPFLQNAGGAVSMAGLLGGLVLFAIAFAWADSSDARRRLRVAFFGTLLGALPFALLVGLHNLSHAPALPGERWAVPFTVLVPLSFSWAMAVHRVFDFRVALRAFTAAVVALAGAALLYLLGEAVAASLWPALGTGVTGGALAALAILAGLAGPARAWLATIGQRIVPIADEWSLRDWTPSGEDEATLMGGACEAVVRALRLDGCAAFRFGAAGGPVAATGALVAPTLSPAAADALRRGSAVLEPADAGLSHEDLDTLERAGVRWLVPVTPRLALALGRRIAGAWLSREDARALGGLAHVLAVAIENLELKREARDHGVLAREMRVAQAVQMKRLPRRTPVFPTLDCAASTLATEAVGGDYYDFVGTGSREFTLAVGDAAGHGVPAAIVLAGVQARFRDEAQRARHPGALLEAMNRDLVALEQPEHFMGLLCARVDAATGAVRFANAGLTPPVLRRRDGRIEILTESGLLLGVQGGSRYAVASVDLEPGDVLIVYTDGLSEASRAGEQFGEGPLAAVLHQHAHRRATDLVEELIRAVRAWADGPLDDLTVVVLKQLACSRATGQETRISPLKSGIGPADTYG